MKWEFIVWKNIQMRVLSQENMINEKHKERDVNQPNIYIRRFRRSSKASKAKSSYKKLGNTRVYDNSHCCFYCSEIGMHMSIFR
jgi:hypothetical protein